MLDAHPFADLFPMMDGPDFDLLVDDIRENGLRAPIVLYEGRVLDGRNRQKACAVLGIAPDHETYAGDDPLGYVVSVNIRRRHLTASQRAMIADRMATLRHGQTKRKGARDAELRVSRADAATALNVSSRSVSDARKVATDGAGPVVKAVESGKLAVDVAARLARLDRCDQAAVLKKARTGDGVDKRRVVQEIKKARREDRLRALCGRCQALPDRKYGVVYADPPWTFAPYSPETGMDRAAGNHYPTASLEVIRSHKPATADDAVLFLWATAPMLVEALDILRAWGFAYKSHCIWDKAKSGTGYWFRSRHELLLVGVKGRPPAPADVPDSVYAEKAGRHSAKPAFFREMIEVLFAGVPRLEMYAREAPPGWDVWGYEAPEAA